MGQVVKLSDYRPQVFVQAAQADTLDSLVPVEFAVGMKDRRACLDKIAEYGLKSVYIRRVNTAPDALLYLISVHDAIWLNKAILQDEELSDEEIAKHIDAIQMLENSNLTMLQGLWASFTHTDNPA